VKSIISRIASCVNCNELKTLRPVETRPEEPSAGVGFLAVGQRAPPHQLGSLGERRKLPDRVPSKFGFWNILEPQKPRQNGQLAFDSEGTSESGGGDKCPRPNIEPPLLYYLKHSGVTPVFKSRILLAAYKFIIRE